MTAKSLLLFAVVATLAAGATRAIAQTPVTVVEYYNKTIAAYFLTGRSAEQATLDTVADFRRTGASFTAVSATGAVAPLDSVCRYRIAVTGSTFSSHFYGLSGDCALIASYQLANFANEGFDFAVERPTAGVCPVSSPMPVYRALRKLTPVDTPNHRYSVSLASYQDQIKQGWTGEGVVFCAKSAVDKTASPAIASSTVFEDRCVAPRTGIRAATGEAYLDRPGTLDDERNWVRSFSNETYLWYRELPGVNVNSYASATSAFNALITPALALSGAAKDRFHYTIATSDYDDVTAGVDSGYGIEWAFVATAPPRKLLVKWVDPGSPAYIAGVRRGASVLTIDGVNLVSNTTTSGINTLNAGVYPATIGETHRFSILDAGATVARTVTLTSAILSAKPVNAAGYITTNTGRVGYLALTTFNVDVADLDLANAVAGLKANAVTDLVLDLRYNSGGFGDISAELAFMIAGPARTAGKTFEKFRFNDKLPVGFGSTEADLITPFYDTSPGYFALAAGQALPTLNLGRVYVLTSNDTASASEGLINGLRGAGVQVILIGSTTHGKPYGFYPLDNCGVTYLTIQFSAVNHLGEGDYVDGFTATCAANDDLTKQLGDPTEKQLAAALAYRATGVCAPLSSVEKRATVPATSMDEAMRAPHRRAMPGTTLRAKANVAKGSAIITPREIGELLSAIE